MRPILLLAAWLLSCSGAAFAAPAGEITHLSGILSVQRADGTAKILAVKSQVDEGDLLATEKDTYARIKFIDGAELVLRPNSRVKVDSYRYEEAKPASDNIFVSLLKGGLRAVTGLVGKRNKEKIAYQTPTATIGIRGTHFGALFCRGDCGEIRTPSGRPLRDGLHLDVASGTVSLTNRAGTRDFAAGKFGFVQDENTPPQEVDVPQELGFRVTMPSSIAVNRGFGDGIGETSCSECIVE